MRWLTITLGLWAAVLFAPLGWLWVTVPLSTVESARPGDAVLIFGALVRSGAVSPLHAERLDTGVTLWREGKAETLVVSNAARAAEVMAAYLRSQGVPEEVIEIDGQATSTPDTCVAEAARATPREVLLVSQAFHLPRIALQCRRLGVRGQYVAAMRAEAAAADAPLWTVVRVRARRHTREALLVWAELLGQYRALERAVSP